MIDHSIETVVPLSEAGRYLPCREQGRQLHRSTLQRWTRRGVRGVRLETLRVGGCLFTSVEALGRFIGRINEAPEASTIDSSTSRADR